MKKLNLQGHDIPEATFREIYFSLDNTPPKAAFIQKIADVTRRSESAVRSWIYGAYQPDALAKEMIEKELGISAEVLFPSKEAKACAQ